MTELYQLEEEEEEEKLKNKHPSVAPSVPSAPLEKVTTLLITGSKTREREREKMNSRKEEKKKSFNFNQVQQARGQTFEFGNPNRLYTRTLCVGGRREERREERE